MSATMDVLERYAIHPALITAILQDCGVLGEEEVPSQAMADQAKRILYRRLLEAERLAINDLAVLYHTLPKVTVVENAKR